MTAYRSIGTMIDSLQDWSPFDMQDSLLEKYAADNENVRLEYMAYLIGAKPRDEDYALEMIDAWLATSRKYRDQFKAWMCDHYNEELYEMQMDRRRYYRD